MKQRRHSPEPVKPSVHSQTEIQLYVRQRLRVGWLTLPKVKVYCKRAFKIDWVLIYREAAQRSRGSPGSGVIQAWEPVMIRMWVCCVSLGTFGYALEHLVLPLPSRHIFISLSELLMKLLTHCFPLLHCCFVLTLTLFSIKTCSQERI